MANPVKDKTARTLAHDFQDVPPPLYCYRLSTSFVTRCFKKWGDGGLNTEQTREARNTTSSATPPSCRLPPWPGQGLAVVA